jgi:nicotinamidase-related amidase
LDSHDPIHIAHPQFWRNSKGEKPNPFTLITADDVKNGTWMAFNPKLQNRALNYVETLAKNARYVLCIWPPHCLIGSWGAAVSPAVHAALTEWASVRFNRVNWVTKGSNFMTEHYSAVMADVIDPQDPSTKINTNLIDALVAADEILITGEALSHCVANTVTDIADNFGDDNIKKLVLLQDTSSNVGGFEKLGQDFVMKMTKRGMRVIKTTDY